MPATATPAADCPDADTALRYLGGDLRSRAVAIEAHIDRCDECRRMFAALARTSLALTASSDGEAGPVPLGEHLPVGTEIDRYRITGVLGRGGMGVVYEADDPQLERSVAVKVLRTSISDAGGARLLAEARAMGMLSHPNVCAVYHVGAIDERYYLVMERIDGRTLTAWLAEQPRSVQQVVDVFLAAGEGLAAAHAIGIVHRDFKPANVLVDATGRVVVSDFGLAQSEDRQTEEIGGTPHYMAPEQRAGHGDHRVDQHAFAVSLRDALGSRATDAIRGVVDQAGAEDPEQRFADMSSLLSALRGATQRRPTARWAAAALVAVAVTVGVAMILPADPAPSTADEPVPAAATVGQEIQRLVDQAERHRDAGEFQRALAVAERAHHEAETRGDTLGRALARRTSSRAHAQLGNPQDAVDAAKEWFFHASQASRDDVALPAAVSVVTKLAALGRTEEALTWGRHAEGVLERLGDQAPDDVAAFEAAMGRAHSASGDYARGRDRLLRASERLRARSGPPDLRLGDTLADLGAAQFGAGQTSDARATLEETVSIYRDLSGPDSARYAMALAELAVITGASGDPTTAVERAKEAHRIGVATWGAAHPDTLGMEATITTLLLKADAHDEAEARLLAALERTGEELPVRCIFLQQLGTSLQQRDRCSQALPRLRASIDCWTRLVAPGTPLADKAQASLDACRIEPPAE